MFSLFMSRVSPILALRPPAYRIVSQLASNRSLTVTSHSSEGHVTHTSYDGVEDKIEQRSYQQLQDKLVKQEKEQMEQFERLLERQNEKQMEQQERHYMQRMELHRTIVQQAKKNTALAVKFLHSLFSFSF